MASRSTRYDAQTRSAVNHRNSSGVAEAMRYETQYGAGGSARAMAVQQPKPTIYPGARPGASAQQMPSTVHGTQYQKTSYYSQQQPYNARADDQPTKYQLVLEDVLNHFQNKKKRNISNESMQTINNFEYYFDRMWDYLSRESTDAVKLKDQNLKEHEQLDEAKKLISDKISHSLSHQLSQNESTLENISIKCRPTNVVEEFEILCTTEWHTAKDCLDKLIPDDNIKYDFLLDIMKVAEVQAKEQVNAKLSIFSEASMKRYNVLDALKVSVDDGIIPDLTEVIQPHLMGKYKNVLHQILSLEKISPDLSDTGACIKAYIKACGEVAWKMAIQKPRMELYIEIGKNERFDENVQEPYWGSDNPKTGKVIRYVHPALKHQGKILKKGTVIVKK